MELTGIRKIIVQRKIIFYIICVSKFLKKKAGFQNFAKFNSSEKREEGREASFLVCKLWFTQRN